MGLFELLFLNGYSFSIVLIMEQFT